MRIVKVRRVGNCIGLIFDKVERAISGIELGDNVKIIAKKKKLIIEKVEVQSDNIDR